MVIEIASNCKWPNKSHKLCIGNCISESECERKLQYEEFKKSPKKSTVDWTKVEFFKPKGG